MEQVFKALDEKLQAQEREIYLKQIQIESLTSQLKKAEKEIDELKGVK